MPSAESVADSLRRDILSGLFEPGDRLREVQLAERYRCGRTAVRSALVELTSEGLVEREANRGATVPRISGAEAIQIIEARAVLEALIAAGAARRATPQNRAELDRVITDMRAAVSEGRTRDYTNLNELLHLRLREISGLTIAGQLVANLRNRAVHHHYRLASMPGRLGRSLEQHSIMVRAITAGDEAAAAAAMHDHFESMIEEVERWDGIDI